MRFAPHRGRCVRCRKPKANAKERRTHGPGPRPQPELSARTTPRPMRARQSTNGVRTASPGATARSSPLSASGGSTPAPRSRRSGAVRFVRDALLPAPQRPHRHPGRWRRTPCSSSACSACAPAASASAPRAASASRSDPGGGWRRCATAGPVGALGSRPSAPLLLIAGLIVGVIWPSSRSPSPAGSALRPPAPVRPDRQRRQRTEAPPKKPKKRRRAT